MHMDYKFLIFLITFLPSLAFSQTVKDGLEFRSDKKNIEMNMIGSELPFQKTEIIRLKIHPHFHKHDEDYQLDTILVYTADWVKEYGGLESGLFALHIQGKKLHKMNRLMVRIGDPMSPRLESDTFAVEVNISYRGDAKIKKDIELALHVNGSSAQSMSWVYLSPQISLEPNKEECLEENAPAEVADFKYGYVQEINFYGDMPSKFSTFYNGGNRKYCFYGAPKLPIKTSVEVRNIILRHF